MSMVNDISWGSEDNMKECESNAQLASLCKEMRSRTMVIALSLFREKSGILSVKIVHKVGGIKCLGRNV